MTDYLPPKISDRSRLEADQLLREELAARDVPRNSLRHLPPLPSDAEGVLLYGSRARGDWVQTSDVDLVVLTRSGRPTYQYNPFSVSYYTEEMLRSGIGSLFGAHLKRDSAILWDPTAQLVGIINAMGEVDAPKLMRRVRHMSQLFTTPKMDLPQYLPGLSRQARFLLRSSLYAHEIDAGRPCFSVRELAARYQEPELARLLASAPTDRPNEHHLLRCLDLLEGLIGAFPDSEHGSVDATIINCWDSPGDLLSAAFMSLGSTSSTDYAEVGKILL